MHWGEMIEDRVDERGEVALLTRNIVIRGEMLSECPDENENCDDYNFDTFGGHVKVWSYCKALKISDIKVWWFEENGTLAPINLAFKKYYSPDS